MTLAQCTTRRSSSDRGRRVHVLLNGSAAAAALAWATASLRHGDRLVSAAGAPADLIVRGHSVSGAVPQHRVGMPTVWVPASWTVGRAADRSVAVLSGASVVPDAAIDAAMREAARADTAVLIVQPSRVDAWFPDGAGYGETAAQEAHDAQIASWESADSGLSIMAEIAMDGASAALLRQAARVGLVVVDCAELARSTVRRAADITLNELGVPVLVVPARSRSRRSRV